MPLGYGSKSRTPTKIGSLKWVVNSPTNQNGIPLVLTHGHFPKTCSPGSEVGHGRARPAAGGLQGALGPGGAAAGARPKGPSRAPWLGGPFLTGAGGVELVVWVSLFCFGGGG